MNDDSDVVVHALPVNLSAGNGFDSCAFRVTQMELIKMTLRRDLGIAIRSAHRRHESATEND